MSGAPYHFSRTAIGAFGLAGVIGALMAARAGRWADCGHAQRTTAAALLTLLLAWWPLSLLQSSLWALLIGIVLLDLGGQALHVTNQSLILRPAPRGARQTGRPVYAVLCRGQRARSPLQHHGLCPGRLAGRMSAGRGGQPALAMGLVADKAGSAASLCLSLQAWPAMNEVGPGVGTGRPS